MKSELTNLLPPERARSLRTLYLMRLATVAVLVFVGVALIHSVLLLPAYLYLGEQVKGREALLASLSASIDGNQEKEATARTAALTNDATYLTRLSTMPTASAAIRAVLLVPHTGIRIKGFAYAPAQTGKEAQLRVSGVAGSRDALRRYEEALSREPYVTSTELPISSYAKESDIPFTIALTGSLMP